MKSGALLIAAIALTGSVAWMSSRSSDDTTPPTESDAAPSGNVAGSNAVNGAMNGALPPGHPPIPGHGAASPPAGNPHGPSNAYGPDTPLPPGHPAIQRDGAAPEIEIRGAKNAQGPTVAQIVRDRTKLEGSKVKLVGTVVKRTSGVLGKTWLHVQDGSGDAQAGDHDIVVTTQALPEVGEVVTIEGTVVCDEDLGSGYRYEVLIEDASITAEKP